MGGRPWTNSLQFPPPSPQRGSRWNRHPAQAGFSCRFLGAGLGQAICVAAPNQNFFFLFLFPHRRRSWGPAPLPIQAHEALSVPDFFFFPFPSQSARSLTTFVAHVYKYAGRAASATALVVPPNLRFLQTSCSYLVSRSSPYYCVFSFSLGGIETFKQKQKKTTNKNNKNNNQHNNPAIPLPRP